MWSPLNNRVGTSPKRTEGGKEPSMSSVPSGEGERVKSGKWPILTVIDAPRQTGGRVKPRGNTGTSSGRKKGRKERGGKPVEQIPEAIRKRERRGKKPAFRTSDAGGNRGRSKIQEGKREEKKRWLDAVTEQPKGRGGKKKRKRSLSCPGKNM